MSKVDCSDLIGVPFVYDGRDENGLDCYGLVKAVYKRYGVDLPEYYEGGAFSCEQRSEDTSRAYFEQKALGVWKPCDRSDLPVPCLLGLRFNTPPGVVNHVGVYIGDGRFIHTRDRIGVCIDRIDSIIWSRRIEGFYTYGGQ